MSGKYRVAMSMRHVTGPELGRLLAMYEVLDDLAHDLSGGEAHESYLAELWGFVKAHGSPCPGLTDRPAYCLRGEQGEPLSVVESDGSIIPPTDWAGMKCSDAGLPPDTPVSHFFEAVAP